VTGVVGVVTDSTAYLPPVDAATLDVRVVPLQVVVDGESYDEGTAEASDVLLAALRARVPVTTSRPSPEAFAAVYDTLRREGAAAVVSLHLSGAMSGTLEAAQLAAREAALPVTVVDSEAIAMALGFAVLDAARLARTGADVTTVVEGARRRLAATTTYFYVDSLDQLRRGGRIGTTQAVVGQALAVKPLLRLADGRIEPWERVRTSGRALARLQDAAVEAAGTAEVDVAVHHLGDPAAADELGARLSERIPGLQRLVVSEVGAVVGAHTGIGMLGVAVAPAAPTAPDGPGGGASRSQ
jgi:DegV family protein with EDD domain